VHEPGALTGYATALARLWFYSGDNCAQRAIAATEYRLLRSEMPKLRAAAQPPQAFLADGQTER